MQFVIIVNVQQTVGRGIAFGIRAFGHSLIPTKTTGMQPNVKEMETDSSTAFLPTTPSLRSRVGNVFLGARRLGIRYFGRGLLAVREEGPNHQNRFRRNCSNP